MSTLRTAAITALLLACAGAATAIWPHPAAPRLATPIAPAAPLRLIAEGRIEARPGAEVRLGAEVAARITEVAVAEGVRVARGDLVVQLDAAGIAAELAAAGAGLAAAAAGTGEAHARCARLGRSGSAASAQELAAAERDVAVADARRDAAAAATRRLEVELGKYRITAPIAGVVVERAVHAGELVAPGTHLLTIADPGRLWVVAEVDEWDAGAVRPGQAATVRAQGDAATVWRGHVEAVPIDLTLRGLEPGDPGRPVDAQVLRAKLAIDDGPPLRLRQRVDIEIRPGSR